MDCRTRFEFKKPSRFIATGFFFFSFYSASSLLAATPQTTDLFSLNLEELLKIEISGPTLASTSRNQVPAAVTVFNHSQIQRSGVQNLHDLLLLVPGFQSYRSGLSSYHYPISSRGRRNTTSSNEVLVLLDGVRLNEPRTGGITNIIAMLPVDHIERIEFIRGPGAALYGSNAMLGVINIVRRKEVREVGVGFGNNTRKHIHAAGYFSVNEFTVDFFGRVDKDDGDSYQVSDNITDNLINTHDPYNFSDIYLNINHKNTTFSIFHNEQSSYDFLLANNISEYYSTSKHDRYSAFSLKQDFNWNELNSWIQFSHTKFDSGETRIVNDAGMLALADQDVLSKSNIDTQRLDKEWRLQLHSDWRVNDNKQLQFGLEYRRIKIPESTFQFNPNTENAFYSTLQPDSKRQVGGLYAQYQTRLHERHLLTAGVRYDHFSSLGSQLSPRLGWVYEMSASQSLKILYGEAFRAPAESELNVRNNQSVIGSETLQPETVQSTDIIWLKNWSKASVTAGFFFNHFHDVIEQRLINNTLQYVNSHDKNDAKGYEIELTLEAADNLLLHGSFTRILSNPASSFREAKTLASANINYQRNKWNFSLSASYHDERDLLMKNGEIKTLDDCWVLFGKASYFLQDKTEVYLTVKNINDDKAISPSLIPRSFDGIQSRGREILVGLTVNF